MFKNILVPTDGSPLSRQAIKRAVNLAKEQKARVTALYVGPEWRPTGYGDFSRNAADKPAEHAAIVQKTADRILGVVKKAAAAAGVPCACSHVMGSVPYDEIVKASQRSGCDLIVMASHGRRGISWLLLGSETSKVLAHSKIPVLVER